jgi:hypothetical protein
MNLGAPRTDFVDASLFEKLAAAHTWRELSSYISNNGLTI